VRLRQWLRGIELGGVFHLDHIVRLHQVAFASAPPVQANGTLSDEITGPAPADALQLALAAGHQADYLLTWNYAHLANPVTQAKSERLLLKWQWRSPLLVSPESIPQVRLNQTIRRKSDA